MRDSLKLTLFRVQQLLLEVGKEQNWGRGTCHLTRKVTGDTSPVNTESGQVANESQQLGENPHQWDHVKSVVQRFA